LIGIKSGNRGQEVNQQVVQSHLEVRKSLINWVNIVKTTAEVRHLKISTRARYSIRLMSYLADHATSDKPTVLKEIAERQGLSTRYLEQLVVPLKNAQLIKSVAGKHGGYYLARPSKDIMIGEIVEAAIGPIQLLDCLEPDTDCHFKEVCKSRRMWGLINTRITDVLYDYTLDDLSEKSMIASLEEINVSNEGDSLPC
jgi:Rrf2 family protein